MPTSRTWFAALLAISLLLSAENSKAELSLHGFIQGNYGLNTASANPEGKDSKLAEERAQLKLEADQGPWRLFVKTDLAWDHLDDQEKLELREGTLDYAAASWDLKLGRQMLTWGLGDLVFINDVFPKDYEAFFAGRPLEYLKKGVDGVKIGLYPGFASFEVVAIPQFTANHFPEARRFWLYDPLPGVTNRQTVTPDSSLDHTEVAVRAYRDLAGFDLSLYGYRGFYRQPAMQLDNPAAPTQLTLWYPRLAVYGASLQGSALDGVVSLEGGYYDSRDDQGGSNPLIPNSQARFLLGYQRQFWEDFTVGLQYYGERMLDYGTYTATLPPGLPVEKRLHDLVSVRLTQLLRHQTVKLSLFAFRGLSSGDYLVNPEIKYNLSDQVWVALGANIFGGGEPWSQFGQLDRNDSIYLQTRYEF
ncbi:MAG: hypothetical protein A2520_05930 [Deltaproteobacteria bacterium RIFOXYD12_FULL_53_23]|nr:MAG: hypothetical protein A2520_05930 [Deltaproteobacteria bacterium RIFOXYD12_FULL_53_23]